MGLLHKHHATKLVSYPINQILRLKMTLQTDPKFVALVGKKIKAERARYIAERIGEKYIPRVDPGVLASSVLFLARGRMTQEKFKRLCWALAAGTKKLRRGEVLKPWRTQHADEWVPMQIMEVLTRRSYNGKVGANVVFKALAGTCCGREMKRFWSMQFARFISKTIGFSRKRKIDRMEELVGLRLYGLVERERSREEPFFDQIDLTSKFLEWNRKLIAKRHRVDFECPKKFKHACHQCPIGYDVCPLAVHARTYVKAKCQKCKETKYTDPLAVTLEICVDCQRAERFTRKRN